MGQASRLPGMLQLGCGYSFNDERIMLKALHGVVHGKSIELTEDLGLADGEQVEVVVKSRDRNGSWGEGLRRCAGALAAEWTDEDDRILRKINQDRKHDTRREVAE